MVMTSTLSTEEAQHFYRKLGHQDAGCLMLNSGPLEIVVTKSLTSSNDFCCIAFAVGLAVHEGKISSMDDWVIDYLPERDHELMRQTTIRHLLTRTHGIDYDENNRLYRVCGTLPKVKRKMLAKNEQLSQ